MEEDGLMTIRRRKWESGGVLILDRKGDAASPAMVNIANEYLHVNCD